MGVDTGTGFFSLPRLGFSGPTPRTPCRRTGRFPAMTAKAYGAVYSSASCTPAAPLLSYPSDRGFEGFGGLAEVRQQGFSERESEP